MKALVLAISVMSLFLAGCASEFTTNADASSSDAPFVEIPTDGSPFVPSGTGVGQGAGTGGNYIYGSTANMTLTNMATFTEYTKRPVGTITNPRVNMNFQRVGTKFGGTVTVSYVEDGVQRESVFTTGPTENEVIFNVWHDENGQPYFHAVLEDFLGGLVIVIDDFIDFGDGNGPQAASGSVWFKNFETTVNGQQVENHPPTRCWFVEGYYKGTSIQTPYDCRPWPVSSTHWYERNNTYMQAEPAPSSGYLKLGTFNNMDIEDAFNGQVTLTDIF